LQLVGREGAVRAALLLLLASCAAAEVPTGIVVEVDTDLAIPSAADAIRVRVRDDQGSSLHEVSVDLRQGGPGSRLPGRLALQPVDASRLSPIAVEATALQAGHEVVRQEVRLGFRKGAVVLLRMALLAGCACQPCGSGETCADGARCTPVARDVDSLPLYVPRSAGEGARPPPTSCPEAYAPGDAGVEASSAGKDGGAPLDGNPVIALPAGASCTSSAQCGSRSCVDGVCCASACASVCTACAKAFTGQPDGQCAPVRAGTDPRADCAADAPTSCRYDGTCDGAGACRLYAAGTLCGPPTCEDGVYAPPSRCTGAGVCKPETPRPCLLFFACTLDQGCLTRCQSHADCTADAYCAATGECVPGERKGQPCTENRECLSGSCAPDHHCR
jgi:hypothetical protein